MRTNAPLYSLNAGEVSKIAVGRVDIAKLRIAGECQVNWLPYVLGPMMLRPGLLHSGEVLGDNPAKLIRFVFSKLDTALLELTANTMRVWIDEVLLTRPAVATTIGDPNFVNTGAWSSANTTAGATVTIAKDASDDFGACVSPTPVGGLAQIQQTVSVAAGDRGIEHGIRIVVTEGPVMFRAGLPRVPRPHRPDLARHRHPFAVLHADDGELRHPDRVHRPVEQDHHALRDRAAGIVALPTPWGTADLSNIRYDQSGDIIFVACYGQQQRMIERRGARPGARGWSVVRYRSTTARSTTCRGGRRTSRRRSIRQRHPDLRQAVVPTRDMSARCSGCSRRAEQSGRLGAQNAFTNPVRISGVGNDRLFSWIVSGTWSGNAHPAALAHGPISDLRRSRRRRLTASSTTTTPAAISPTMSSAGCGSVSSTPATMSAAPRPSSSAIRAADFSAPPSGGVQAGGQYGICRVTGYVRRRGADRGDQCAGIPDIGG